MNKKGTWLTTFSDVITLLITFFTLILSMSSMDVKVLKKSFNFFIGGFGIINYGNNSNQVLENIKKELGVPLVNDELKVILYLMNKFSLPPKKAYKLYLLNKNLSKFKYNLEVINNNDVKISINVSKLYKPVSYEFTNYGKLFAESLVKIMKNYKGSVKFKMYTSKFPIETDLIKDNIDLSIKRLSKLVDFLKEKNINNNMLAIGWGDIKVKKNLLEIELKDYLKINRRKLNG